MMSAKKATPGLLKKRYFEIKVRRHNFCRDVTNKILSCDSNYIADVFMWPVIVAFLWEKLSKPQFFKDLTRKAAFFQGWSWFKFNNLELAVVANLNFYTCVTKGLKLKVRKFWWLILTFVEVAGGKLVGEGGGFLLTLQFWIGLMLVGTFIDTLVLGSCVSKIV